MIVPSIALLSLASVVLGNAPQGMMRRQTTSTAAQASPSQALAASITANANIAAIIELIAASGKSAAAIIASLSASAAAARTSTTASTTATASTSRSATSTGVQPSATCYDNSDTSNAISTIRNADLATGVCASSCTSFNATVSACYDTSSSNTAIAECLCKSAALSTMFNCAGCEDSMDVDGNEGYYTRRAVSFCNQCITVGFQSSGSCGAPVPQGNPSLPACPVPTVSPSASVSASASASATLSGSASASASASPIFIFPAA